MKDSCYICETKEDIGPKLVKKEYIEDKRMRDPILTFRTLVLCDSCYAKLKEGELKINIVKVS